MKVVQTNISHFHQGPTVFITDEYARRHEQELLRKMKESVGQSSR